MSIEFSIGNKIVGEGAPVFLVAELSANHGHDRSIALRTIEAAAKAGADAIKLQTYTPDTLTLNSDAPPFVVKTKNEWSGRTLYDLYKEAMTPWEWHADLFAAAHALGLECFSTPFDATAVAFLESLDAPAHKVASFEITDLPLVEAIARTGKPVIISTGMATLSDIEAAVAVCRECGNDKIALLRCVSSYPARPETMDLRSYDVLSGFNCVLGLSDHTRDVTVAIASVALGARLIEKHFIVDRTVGGPDAFFSLDPDEFGAMVKSVRQTEKALGKVRFGPGPDELASTAFRRSLFVARDVKAGQVLTCDHIRSVRPSDGLAPRHLPTVLGRGASRDLAFGTPVSWDAVGPVIENQISLRPAAMADADRLLNWRNDAVTRAMSLEQSEISRAEHETWLATTLDSKTRSLMIAEQNGAAIGTVRLDFRPSAVAEISLTVAPGYRGQGYAVGCLRSAEAYARGRDCVTLVATIRAHNDRSISAFKRAGYYGFHESGDIIQCTRRIKPFT